MNALALPNRRVEDWKYSDLRGAIDEAEVAAAPAANWSVVVAQGAEAGALPKIAPRGEHGAMAALAISTAKAGIFIRVAKNHPGFVQLELSEPGHARAVIVIEDGASLVLRETTTAKGFSNVAVDIAIGRNAGLTHFRLAPATETVRIADVAIRVAAGGAYRAHFAELGGKLARTELHIALEDDGAQAHLSGACVVANNHADITTHLVHAAPDTQSTQLFKYVAGNQARGVYQGKITVAEGADGSDSRQTAKGLLLAERAEIDLKPELEIFADDVKCAHGAAIGDLDADSLFYLRSRGIPEVEARNLLIRAFLEEAFADVNDPAMHEILWNAVEAALPQAAAP